MSHAEGVCTELGSGEDVHQLGELTEDVGVRRHVLTVKGNPKSTEDHQVRNQGDDVVQRLLTAFDEDRFRDGASPLCWLVEHLLQLGVCGQVLEEIELVAIARRREESQDRKTKKITSAESKINGTCEKERERLTICVNSPYYYPCYRDGNGIAT